MNPIRTGPRTRFAIAAPLLLAAGGAHAVMPITPQLDAASRAALVRSLAEAGIPEAGSSAVLISLTSVLGTGPAARRHRYRQPYPQLPDVDARAQPGQAGCANVRLEARPKAEPRRRVAITGTYCLSDPARYIWTARALSVR